MAQIASPATGSLFARARAGVKAKAFDAEGKEVEFDVREDEEQTVKLDETVELLLAAGYFRARIKGLAPFDKVVGGMTWCLTASSVDVDVDLLFTENSTIKQKISLTEKIVAALKKLKCPHRIEPYQIQGLDFIHIYPVVQWLVKKAIETREEMNQAIRARTLLEYGKNNKTQDDSVETALASFLSVKEAFKPKRQFRARAAQGDLDLDARVHTTLLEYGRRYGVSKQQPKETSDKKSAVAKGLGATEGPDAHELEEKRVRSLMSNMAESGGLAAVSTAVLGSLVSMQQAEIAQLSGEYAADAATRASVDNERADGMAAHKRRVGALQKQIEAAQKKIEGLEGEYGATRDQLRAAKEEARAAVEQSQALAAEQERLDHLEGDDATKAIVAKLRHLVALNESLKGQETQFKATCKTEMAALQARIAALRGEGYEVMDTSAVRTAEINQQYEEDMKKLQKLRQQSAKRAREYVKLQRQIDAIPSRAELAQYQRRFIELYEQMSAKHRETKQHFILYNTLYDVRMFMEKEVSLLTSIHDNFTLAMSSNANKEKFLEQMTNIVAGVKANLEKMEDKHATEKQTRDKLSDKHLELVEVERQYLKAVKEQEAEFAKSEALQAKQKKKAAS